MLSRSFSRYADRREAGRILADDLADFADRPDVVVLGLPRGGVPVAAEVAAVLHAPLDVLLVRKLGLPGHSELAMGAIASGGVRVLNDSLVRQLQVPEETIEAVAAAEGVELERRERAYRGASAAVPLDGRTVIVVDDGLATGATMRAAVVSLRRANPERVIVAVPVGAPETCDALSAIADAVICPLRPERLTAVGMWYEEFNQTTDDDVRALLASAPAAGTHRGNA
jgi:putative phosphoribosyl transferase